MQPPLTYSWIALTASAPVILLLTTWTLAVFHCRRRQWSTMDVFLVSILSQSIVQQFLGFIYSTLVLFNFSSVYTGDAVCTGMMWFFITIPIFKGTTITSLAVDRWLFYDKFSYRLSVRKNHIRYHIAVLAVLSCTIGFTALITFNNPELLKTTTNNPFDASQYSFDQCTFLPFKFDIKFLIFYISVHLLTVLIGIVALTKSLCHKNNIKNNLQQNQKPNCKRRRKRSLPLDLTPTLSNTSTASSSISTITPSAFFSTPGLTAKAVLSSPPNNAYQLRHKILLDFHDRNKKEEKKLYRLSTAIVLLILTIICTHLPFTIGTILSKLDILVPRSEVGVHGEPISILNWPVTNVVLWFQVFEGLAILLVLYSIIPGWIFNRTTKKISKSGKTQNLPNMQQNRRDVETTLNKPNSPSIPSALNNKSPQHYTNAAYTPDYKNGRFPMTNGSLFAAIAPSSCSNRTQSILESNTSNDRLHRVLDNANHSQRLSRNDAVESFRQAFPEDDSEYDKKSYNQRYASVASCVSHASVTTVANDDFEFHHSGAAFYQRPSRNGFTQATYVIPSKIKQELKKKKPFQREMQTNESVQCLRDDYDSKEIKVLQPLHMGVNPPPTSLSMNDLDLIDDNEFQYYANASSSKPTISVTNTTDEYKQKRMYRKRSRMHANVVNDNNNSRRNYKTFDHPTGISRRVLSMECLSPQKKETDRRNFFDISYLDTGDILVRKADSNKCIFVTDFL